MLLKASAQAVALCVAGLAVVGVGIFLRLPSVVAWGSGLWIGVALARALTQLRIAKVRSAGFEMRWHEPERSLRVARGQPVTLQAEVINHDLRAVRCSGMRALHDGNLSVRVSPDCVEIPGQHSVTVSVVVEGARVGRHGVHGLSLDLSSGPQLFWVPLTFANPFGVEVLPKSYQRRANSALGGRSRRESPFGFPRKNHGESGEFSEIRDHQAGDPLKRIAWRASARRGKLLVRDYELQEHEVVWLVLDASVELWAGPAGSSPLDLAIDELSALSDHHLSMGDSVGLVMVGARELKWLAPQSGPRALGKILETVAFESHTLDADRSGLDEHEVASWVLEHLRALSPQAMTPQGDDSHAISISTLAQRAKSVLSQAPFPQASANAASERERDLRRYLAGFGISSPARLQQDRSKTDEVIAATLLKIGQARPRATRVCLCSPSPDANTLSILREPIARLRRHHIQLTWLPSAYEPALALLGNAPDSKSDSASLRTVSHAVRLRMRVLGRQGDSALQRLGVKLHRAKRHSLLPPPPGAESE
ncbi:MAG TPA: DUF58 domain-containing protein [Polyangiaceae bacterium]|nr:DUF58 domain-containing protein [Polyangiaceae bacterium]